MTIDKGQNMYGPTASKTNSRIGIPSLEISKPSARRKFIGGKDSDFLPTGFETFEQAKERREILIRRLRSKGGLSCLLLARDLERCRKNQRCELEVCAVCQRRWRMKILRQLSELMGDAPCLTRASIIPKGGRISPGELKSFDLTKFVRSRQRALQRAFAPEVVVFGGVDISWNTDSNDDGHWQVHLYLLVFAPNSSELQQAVKKRFPPEPTAMKPYEFKEVSMHELPVVASYAIKAGSYHRSGYLGSNGRRNTISCNLKPAQAIELAIFGKQHSPGSRLIMRGLKRYRTKGGLRLKLV